MVWKPWSSHTVPAVSQPPPCQAEAASLQGSGHAGTLAITECNSISWSSQAVLWFLPAFAWGWNILAFDFLHWTWEQTTGQPRSQVLLNGRIFPIRWYSGSIWIFVDAERRRLSWTFILGGCLDTGIYPRGKMEWRAIGWCEVWDAWCELCFWNPLSV